MVTLLKKINGTRKALYRCECGKEFEAFTYNVNKGHTTSCGCLRLKALIERSTTHGQRSGQKEGRQRSRAYVAWVNMRQRCTNPKRKDFVNYGKRGLMYSTEWEYYQNFLTDMGEPGEGMTLERRDNSGDYTKDNCYWAPRVVQNNNRRNNVRYTFDGKTLTLVEWAKTTGIGRITILKRLQRGLSIEDALKPADLRATNSGDWGHADHRKIT